MGLGKIVRWSNIEEGKAEVLAWNNEPRNEQWDEYNTATSTLMRLVEKDEPTEQDESLFYRTLKRARELRAQHIKEAQTPSYSENGWIWLLYAAVAAVLYLLLSTKRRKR